MFCHSTQFFLLLFQVSPGERTARGTSMREAMWLSVATSRFSMFIFFYIFPISSLQAICITVFVFSSILLSSLAIAFARPWNGMMDNLKRVDYVKLVLCVCVWYCFPANWTSNNIEFIFCRPGSKSWWKRCLWTNNEWNFNCGAVRSTSVKFKRHWLSKWNAVPTLAKCLICKSLARQGRSNLSLICVKLAWKMDFEELD